MNCYEHAKAGQVETAIGVCPHCGAGLCAEHARECEVENVTYSSVGNPTIGTPSRQLCCDTCHQASMGGCTTKAAGGVTAARVGGRREGRVRV